ncbi:MAG TPA: hypothetical protein GX011_04700 [Clostridiales bacterium]|jgi:hypothetical protein|nr:hypothetical protein [Clostridiales bacterium]
MAIKGCSRQMIVLNGTGSSMFETAYFIVKPDADTRPRSHGDLLREANRIVEENSFRVCDDRRKPPGLAVRIWFYIAGVLSGALVTGLIWLAVALIHSPGG